MKTNNVEVVKDEYGITYRTSSLISGGQGLHFVIAERRGYEQDIYEYELEFYVDLEPCTLYHGWCASWYGTIWLKLKFIYKVLSGQCIKVSEGFTFRDRTHVEDVIQCLTDGMEHTEKCMREDNEKGE